MRRLLRFPFAFLVAGVLVAAAPAHDTLEREFKECRECPVMLGIPGGTFTMGSPANEPGRFDTEGPQHEVNLKAFALGKFNVTTEEFLLFLKDTGYRPELCNPILNLGWRSPGGGLAYPPFVGQPARWPAACLDWADAQAYVAWVNAKVRAQRPELTNQLANRDGPYRLPSEAEWEFAARAGTTTARWWGDDIGVGRTNCNGCGSPYDYKVLAEVDAFAPNPFGLFGMLGNVWQWTEDCWHESYAGAPADDRAWTQELCDRHVVRGGSWNNLPIFVRSAARSGSIANGGEYDYSSVAGFRLARTLP
jgi:formylglycine-generating enzyme required for sulfatase activity